MLFLKVRFLLLLGTAKSTESPPCETPANLFRNVQFDAKVISHGPYLTGVLLEHPSNKDDVRATRLHNACSALSFV